VLVIRGARGAGKTALFKLASNIENVETLRSFFADPRLPDAKWIDAFSTGRIEHPEVGVLEAQANHASDTQLRAFWMTHLLRRILDEDPSLGSDSEAVQKILTVQSSDVSTWLPIAEQELSKVSSALDHVEKQLLGRGRFIFAGYDGLDLIGPFNHEARRRYISALLSLWLSLSTRYRNLRGKVFLREDLFDPAQLGFVDAGKLRARSESIDWSGESLFRLVVRQLADKSAGTMKLLRSVAGLSLEDRGEDGWMPGQMSYAVQRAFAVKIAPRTIGKGVLKSDAHAWMLARLQDSQERITPRAMLWFLSFAAKHAQTTERAKGPVLDADDLLAALKDTSRSRAGEIQEEYPITRRMERLRGMKIPLSRTKAIEQLQQPVPSEHSTLDARGEMVLDELVRVGVLREMDDGRLDVPDIFRYYFEISPDYAAEWAAFVERDDPRAKENLLRDLPNLAAILSSEGVSLEWPSIEGDIEAGRTEQAREKIATILDLARRARNDNSEAEALTLRGQLLFSEEDYRAAALDFDLATTIFEMHGDESRQIHALHWRGIAEFKARELDLAEQTFRKVAEQSLSRPKLELHYGAALVWQGRVAAQTNKRDRARHLLLSALERVTGSKEGTAWCLWDLGKLAVEEGRALEGARMHALAECIHPPMHSEHARISAERAGLSPNQGEDLRREMKEAYEKDGGWSVLRAVFPELPPKSEIDEL
jgi:tetratricopeptide (TPR) repeat protein